MNDWLIGWSNFPIRNSIKCYICRFQTLTPLISLNNIFSAVDTEDIHKKNSQCDRWLSLWRTFIAKECCVSRISHHGSGLWLVPRSVAPGHYPNPYWQDAMQLNLNMAILIQETGFQNVVREMAAILSPPECVDMIIFTLGRHRHPSVRLSRSLSVRPERR